MNSDMKDRIRTIRMHYGTQAKFAEMLGVKRDNIAKYESGKNKPSETFISLLCQKCNVNRAWLESGDENEPMFLPVDERQAVRAKFEKMLEDAPPSKKAILSALIDLFFLVPDDVWDEIVKKIYDAVEEVRAAEVSPPELTIDEKVEAYRQELLLEEEARERSGA